MLLQNLKNNINIVHPGKPIPVVFWYFNGAELQNSSEVKQFFDGKMATLKFKDVIPDDTGRYEAVATNVCGEVRTACIMTVRGGMKYHLHERLMA